MAKRTIESRHVRWREDCRERITHAFAIDSHNPFKALCKTHSVGQRPKTHRRCADCRKKVGPYVKKAEARRLKAWNRWVETKARAKLLDKAIKGLEELDRYGFEMVLRLMRGLKDDG